MRALVRRPEQAAALEALGAAEVSIGSFEDAGALALAAAGTQAIYHICPNVSRDEVSICTGRCGRGANAQASSVSSIIRSCIRRSRRCRIIGQKMRVEEMLLAAGFDLTILQPTAYMQNILGAWRGIVEDGVFRIPYPVDTRLSLVDLDDVAEVAARVLTKTAMTARPTNWLARRR